MFWFLTSRRLHISISIVSLQLSPRPSLVLDYFNANPTLAQGTLTMLALISFYDNWRHATAFRDQLPPASEFFRRPIDSFDTLIKVWQVHIAITSDVTQEKRRRNVEDVMKRSTYRRAHGIETEDQQGIGAFTWTAREHGVNRMPGLRTEGPTTRRRAPVINEPTVNEATAAEGENTELSNQIPGNEKRHVKKWLGIW